jgi:hypothetical protein
VDLELYLRVIWRFRILVAVGFVLAVLLSVWSTARVSFAHGTPQLAYRQAETFEANTILLVTQKGAAWGNPTGSAGQTGGTASADPSSFSGLATFWAQLVSSDHVQSMIARRLPAPERGKVQVQAAASLPDPSVYNGVLPFIAIQGLAESPDNAINASLVGAHVFMRYIATKQAQAGIKPSDRVLLSLVQRPAEVKVVVPRKKTVPIAVFLVIMISTLGAAFVLENLRPQPRRSAEDENVNQASASEASVTARRVA